MATTVQMVQALLGQQYSSRLSLTGPIRTAGILMRRIRACAVRRGVTGLLDADTDKELETYLAAHFYQQTDPGYTSRSTISASGSFKGKTDMGLLNTDFGQQALLLDPTGCLSLIMDLKKSASVKWLGKPSSESLTYEQRNGGE